MCRTDKQVTKMTLSDVYHLIVRCGRGNAPKMKLDDFVWNINLSHVFYRRGIGRPAGK